MFARGVLLVAVFAMPAGVFARTWVDKTGNYRVEAELVGREGDSVVLRKANGSTVKVPINRLSQADQEHIRQQAASDTASSNPAKAAEPALSALPSASAAEPEDSPPIEAGRRSPLEPSNSQQPPKSTAAPSLPDVAPPDASVSPVGVATTNSAPGQVELPTKTDSTAPPQSVTSFNVTSPAAPAPAAGFKAKWRVSDIVRFVVLLVLAAAVYGLEITILLSLVGGSIGLLVSHFNHLPLPSVLLATMAAAYCIPAGLILVAKKPVALIGPALVLGLPAFLLSHYVGGMTWSWAGLDAAIGGLLLPCGLVGIATRMTGGQSNSSSSSYHGHSDSPQTPGRSELRRAPDPPIRYR